MCFLLVEDEIGIVELLIEALMKNRFRRRRGTNLRFGSIGAFHGLEQTSDVACDLCASVCCTLRETEVSRAICFFICRRERADRPISAARSRSRVWSAWDRRHRASAFG